MVCLMIAVPADVLIVHRPVHDGTHDHRSHQCLVDYPSFSPPPRHPGSYVSVAVGTPNPRVDSDREHRPVGGIRTRSYE